MESLQPNIVVDTRNFAYFIRSLKKINQVTFQCNTNKKIYDTRNTDKITLFHAKHDFFKKKIKLSTVIEWNKLDPTFRNTTSP